MKKFISILMVVIMVLTAVPLSGFVGIDLPAFDLGIRASAKTVASSGSCGANVTYTYNSSTGELVISGEGPMTNYGYCSSPLYGSDIKSVVIESGVTTIGDCAFEYCKSLTSVTIPDSVTTIGGYAFYDCYSLTSVTIGNSVTTIGDYAFYDCENLTSITIPDSVTTIGDYAFRGCTSLTRITVDADNTEYSSNSRGVLFDKNKTVLIQYPAGNTNSSYIIPDSVTTIGHDAFEYCKSLTSVTIPDSVTTIGYSAFYYCYSLTSVYYKGFKEQWNDIKIGPYNKDLLDADINYHYGKHSYNAVLTAPTCTKQGYTTYTCECGDSYKTDYVKEHGHSYKSEITLPTCTKQGYTTYTCECGDSYKADYVNANGHKYESAITTPATHLTKGVKTYTCHCGYSYTESIPKITDHTYSVDTINATCTQNGLAFYKCACGDSYTKTIDKLPHNYSSVVTQATCEKDGYTTYTCKCGDTYVGDNTPAKGHTFNGSACSNCSYDKADSCSCNCHKSGISAIIWKIINFFNKLLRKNNTCSCGAVHY